MPVSNGGQEEKTSKIKMVEARDQTFEERKAWRKRKLKLVSIGSTLGIDASWFGSGASALITRVNFILSHQTMGETRSNDVWQYPR